MTYNQCSSWLLRAATSQTRVFSQIKLLHISCAAHGKWNNKEPKLRKWGLEKFPKLLDTNTGPLVDLPDYTFLDGRPTPLSLGQLARKKEMHSLAQRVLLLVKEMDYAKAEFARKTEEKARKRQEILDSKLLQKSPEP